jgi:hypothetical protein
VFAVLFFSLALVFSSVAHSDEVSELLDQWDCAELLDYQLLLKTAALEGWTLKTEYLDGGSTLVVARAMLHENSLLARRRTILESVLGKATGSKFAVDITGKTILVLGFGSASEVSPERLAELRKMLQGTY